MEKLLCKQTKSPFFHIELLRIYFKIQNLKKALKKAQNSISVKTQNPD